FNPQLVAPGTYPITYTFTTANGCTDSAKSNITVWPSPKAAFKVAEPICEKNNISFSTNSNSSLGKIVNWNWEFGDNSAPISNTNANVVLHNYSTAGSYNIKHWVVSDSGCVSNTATENLIVNFLPKVSFTMPTVVCLPDGKANFGNTSSISDGSENSFSYLWSFGNPQSNEISLLKNPTHTYSTVPPTNGFPVKLVVTSNKGCKDSVTNFFKNVFPQPVANFTINPDSICLNQLVRFVDNSNGQSSNIVDWQWNLGQNDNVTSPNPQKIFRDSGNFTISLQVTNQQGCISAVTQKTMTVYPNPHLKLGGNIYVLEGGSMALRPQNGGLPYYFGNDLRFLWTTKLNPNYMDDATVVSPIVTFPSNIDSAWYKLQLTAKGGCTVSDSLQLVVLRKPKVPNAFSPNGDGFNQTWYIEFIESYPDAIVEVYNRYGQMVFRRVGYKNASGWDGSYQGKPLPVGTYYYIIDPKNGREKLTGSVTIIR
ncbi:MAG: PKD domain-containing protein, partial [Chitinophagaceae bacterium]